MYSRASPDPWHDLVHSQQPSDATMMARTWGNTVNDLRNDLAALSIDRTATPPTSRRPLGLAVGLVVAGLLLIAAWQTGFLNRPRQVEVVRVKLQRPTQIAAETPLLTASGYLVPRRKAVVSAKIQGRLAELHVDEGSRIQKGEVIAELENANTEASLERARAQLERAEAELAEAQRKLGVATNLADKQIGTRDAVAAAASGVRLAKATLRQAHAEVALADAQLDNTVIYAPFDGTVVRKMAEVGESVAPIPPGVNISTASGAIVALADLEFAHETYREHMSFR